MASSFWTFSRQALVPRLFRDHSPSLGRGQAGAHRTQLPDELLTSKSWFILLICATTAHFHGVDVDLAEAIAVLVPGVFASTMTDGLVAVAETRKSGVDAIFVSINFRAFGFSMSGWMVACWTSIRITTWPPRSIMPKIGGFSFSRVPRPRPPFTPRRFSSPSYTP